MRKLAIATALMGVFGLSQSATAGIPVTVVADAPGMLAQVQNYAQMLKDYTAMLNQLQTAQQELQSISGSRGLANLIDSMYDVAMDVNAGDVLNEQGIKTAEDLGLEGDVADVYNKGNENTATWLGQSDKSLEQAKDRFSDLVGLMAKVNASPDQKDILDLQARIGAEQVMLQNEMAKLEMAKSKAEAQQAIQDQRVQQMAIESSGELRNVAW